jgi:hypothetical protein
LLSYRSGARKRRDGSGGCRSPSRWPLSLAERDRALSSPLVIARTGTEQLCKRGIKDHARVRELRTRPHDSPQLLQHSLTAGTASLIPAAILNARRCRVVPKRDRDRWRFTPRPLCSNLPPRQSRTGCYTDRLSDGGVRGDAVVRAGFWPFLSGRGCQRHFELLYRRMFAHLDRPDGTRNAASLTD